MYKPIPYTPEGYIIARKVLLDLGEDLSSELYRNLDGVHHIIRANGLILEEVLDNAS